MMIVNEQTAGCIGKADRGARSRRTSGSWDEARTGWTKNISDIGCGWTLPRWMFSDEGHNTVCDMCKWRLGRERDRIVAHWPRLRAEYPYENPYQRKIQQEAAADWAETREAYIQAGVTILERGEKVTLERLASEVGAASKSTAYTYFKEEKSPSKVVNRLAEQRIQEATRG